jgi:hypothetical protein
MNAKPPER